MLEAIRETSRTCHVVLAKTIERKKSYFAQSDVYDGFDFAPGEQQSKVSWGYVSLPDDVRYVPRSCGLPMTPASTRSHWPQSAPVRRVR